MIYWQAFIEFIGKHRIRLEICPKYLSKVGSGRFWKARPVYNFVIAFQTDKIFGF